MENLQRCIVSKHQNGTQFHVYIYIQPKIRAKVSIAFSEHFRLCLATVTINVHALTSFVTNLIL